MEAVFEWIRSATSSIDHLALYLIIINILTFIIVSIDFLVGWYRPQDDGEIEGPFGSLTLV